MISFLGSLLVMASISTNTISALSTTNSINLKSNSNNFNSNLKSSLDLSLINNQVKNHWVSKSIWNNFQIQNANITLDYHNFNKQTTISWKQVILKNIARGIDYHYKNVENNIYRQENLFTILLNENKSWITILGEKNSTLTLNNNNSDIFNSFSEPAKNISTFYLRISDSNSMNWTTNHSYLDITLNICNLNYTWTKMVNNKLDATIDYSNSVQNFATKKRYDATSGYFAHSLYESKTFTPQDVSPQLSNWTSANYFIDYYYFAGNFGDLITGLTQGYNYNNYYNPYHVFKFVFNYQSALKNSGTYVENSGYGPIVSKSTNQTISGNVNTTKILLVYSSYLFVGNYGYTIADFAFGNNQLNLSMWFRESTTLTSVYPSMYIKANLVLFHMHYNTSIFDNIYPL